MILNKYQDRFQTDIVMLIFLKVTRPNENIFLASQKKIHHIRGHAPTLRTRKHTYLMYRYDNKSMQQTSRTRYKVPSTWKYVSKVRQAFLELVIVATYSLLHVSDVQFFG